ncbi:acyltransferase family protein [Nocardioides jishulii]|uniref:Acyltransferase n=1 Tax=Nocardioides jishulii TaxID=2575440 RepID=A0A4V5TK08_9ACTN|nr:acyltransferase [Nocardioides jishulii]QCX27218.1 acyltransferase [Nocardioides jishulii]TKI61703.1 acyltransferase [Nocardioides jishulii]
MAATEVTGVDPSVRQVRDAQISSLTGMRGFAAIMVVVIHTAGRTEYPWLGVHGYGPIALFVLSGFLLYRPFSRWTLGVGPLPSLRNYSIRRILRIFPAYWAVLHVWYFIYPAAVPSSFGQYLKELTLLNTLQYFGLTQGLQQAWSMGTELTWYVFVPALAAISFVVMSRVPARHRVKVQVWLMLTALPISAGWVWYVHEGAPWQSAGMWLLKYIVCFAFGAMVATVMEAERAGMLSISRGRLLMEDPWLLPLLALLFALVGTSQFGGEHNFGFLSLSEELVRDGCAFGLAGTLLLIAIFSPPRAPFNRFLATRWMQASGRWSYGIYLWHLPLVVMLYEDYTFPEGVFGLVVWLLAILPLSYLLGAASYAWVEVPAMNLSKRLTPSSPRGGARAARPAGVRVASADEARGGTAT